jgi:hypothetical protein
MEELFAANTNCGSVKRKWNGKNRCVLVFDN